MPTSNDQDLLVYAHIGDLHITRPGERNYRDFLAIAAQIETECAAALDFVFLPGDNADNGTVAQYRLIGTALRLFHLPVHVITGDHDMEQGSLDNFYRTLGAAPLPKGVTVGGTRCLFVDIAGPGSGGPDFRFSDAQLAWLATELTAADAAGLRKALFIHAYPADLKGHGQTEALNALIDRHGVALVDMGHTHYNELANDGRTIFAATRSTGQIDEGPVGYSLVALDAGVVSWRFTTLDGAFPLVLITSPADRRLVIDPADPQQVARDAIEVHAVVFGAEAVAHCVCRAGDGAWMAMERRPGDRRYRGRLSVPQGAASFRLTVRAVDVLGRPAEDVIDVAVGALPDIDRRRDGSDADAVGAWPERGIFGTQLGPQPQRRVTLMTRPLPAVISRLPRTRRPS